MKLTLADICRLYLHCFASTGNTLRSPGKPRRLFDSGYCRLFSRELSGGEVFIRSLSVVAGTVPGDRRYPCTCHTFWMRHYRAALRAGPTFLIV